jgi:hypothetical protein
MENLVFFFGHVFGIIQFLQLFRLAPAVYITKRALITKSNFMFL